MENIIEPKSTAPAAYFTTSDGVFMVFIALVFCGVTWLGVFTRQEALKTEAAKTNGEAWATWFKEASKKRFEDNYAYPACAGGDKVGASNAATATALAGVPGLPENKANEAEVKAEPTAAAGTWGGCLAQLLLETSFKDMRNPFTGLAPKHLEACVRSDISLAGDIDIDKSVATPAGSAIAFVKSNLTSTDSIKEKMQLSITVCDKGGYPIKISDVEF